MRALRLPFSRPGLVLPLLLAMAASACQGAAPAAEHPPAPAAAPTAVAAGAGQPDADAIDESEAPPAGDEAAAEGADTRPGHVFQRKPLGVGAVVIESDTTVMDMTITVTALQGREAGKEVTVQQGSTTGSLRRVEVLAVSASGPTKVKVTYQAATSTERNDGASTPSTPKVAGKTYLVEAKGGVTRVVSDTGAAVSEEEEKLVKEDFSDLGDTDSLQQALPELPIKVGARVASLAQYLAKKSTKDKSGNVKVANATATLAAVRDVGGVEAGVFDITLDAVMTRSTSVLSFKMKAQVEVRMDTGLPLSVVITAPVKVTANKSAANVQTVGSGTMTMTLGWKYL